MNILQINCVYNQGSTGKIVECISRELLNQGHNVLTCYGIGDTHCDDHSVKVCSEIEHGFNALYGRISGIPFGGIYLSNYRIRKMIMEFHPDIIHVHCVNGYMMNVYRLLKYLAINHIKTVLTLHSEIFHTAGCGHAYECEKWKSQCSKCNRYKEAVGSWFFDRSKVSWEKMYNAINSFDEKDLIITAVSPWLTDRARQSPIVKHYRLRCVLNGLDTSLFCYRDKIGIIDRNHFEKVVLFVTPYFGLEETDVKGGRFLGSIAAALPDYKFLVVSGRMSSNLGRLPDNVQIWGRAKDQEELAQLYSEADVTMLLSRRETFSMVTVESLCCGTPVVGFKAGGPESIAIKDYAEFVEYGDVGSMIRMIRETKGNSDKRSDKIKHYAERFDSKQMAKCYYRVYQDLLDSSS